MRVSAAIADHGPNRLNLRAGSSEPEMLVGRLADQIKFNAGVEQNQRADDRHDKSGRVKAGTGCRFRKESGDQTADDGTADAEQAGKDEAEVLDTRHNFLGNPATNETDNNRPNDV